MGPLGALPKPMDLELWPQGDSARLLPRSVHGMLWLQRQFDPSTWELVCQAQVRLTVESCRRLMADAHEAGLLVAERPLGRTPQA